MVNHYYDDCIFFLHNLYKRVVVITEMCRAGGAALLGGGVRWNLCVQELYRAGATDGLLNGQPVVEREDGDGGLGQWLCWLAMALA